MGAPGGGAHLAEAPRRRDLRVSKASVTDGGRVQQAAHHHFGRALLPVVLSHDGRPVERPVVFVQNAPARADEGAVELKLVGRPASRCQGIRTTRPIDAGSISGCAHRSKPRASTIASSRFKVRRFVSPCQRSCGVRTPRPLSAATAECAASPSSTTETNASACILRLCSSRTRVACASNSARSAAESMAAAGGRRAPRAA